jgi:hypothetical protein
VAPARQCSSNVHRSHFLFVTVGIIPPLESTDTEHRTMTAQSETNRPTTDESRDEEMSAAQRRQQIQHHRAKRLDRRDPSRTLTIKRARNEILSRV